MKKHISVSTYKLISKELQEIPEEYQKNYNSMHEGYAVLLEEVRELENEVFFGKKKAGSLEAHKQRVREEAVQVAAVAIRIIQELTL